MNFPISSKFAGPAALALSARERLVGLGEHNGPLNLCGQSRLLWNSDPGGTHGPASDPLYMPLPVYLSLQPHGSYLIFFENSFRARFDFDSPRQPAEVASAQPNESTTAMASFDGGALRYYLIAGSPGQILDQFTELTGRPVLPPRWSLGYHQCRWGYKSESDIRAVLAGFKQHDLPLHAIHLDIDYMNGYRVFTVDPQRFPDLPALAKEIHEQDVRLVTIIDPGVKKDSQYSIYTSGSEQGLFTVLPGSRPLTGVAWPGEAAFPDFTNPETRRWWGKCYQTLLDAGVDGIWHDMNEPASFVMSGDSTLPLATEHHLDGIGGDHLQAHNLYGYQMNRAAFEGLQAIDAAHRPWIVSRSGWVGNPRYTWNWTADVETSWDGLRQTVATLIGMSISGIPFTGSDIGGFTGDPSPELFVRWFQMAAFTAFMRTHSAVGTSRREPWVFGEPYTTNLRNFLKLRCSLQPYLYTTAWQAATRGWPFIRPLFWGNSTDHDLWDVEDLFFLGDNLLVAPVLEPLVKFRSVRLPNGSWFNFWNDECLAGPGVREFDTSLEQIPVLVRNPGLLPMEDGDTLTLRLYTDGNQLPEAQSVTVGWLYSDAGDGYGPQRRDHFALIRTGDTIRLSWQTQGDFPFSYRAINLEIHGCEPGKYSVNDTPLTTTAPLQFTEPFHEGIFRG